MLSRDEIRAEIEASLAKSGIEQADVRIQPDGTGAWKVAVIASGFESLASEARVSAAGTLGIRTSWVDLLTPEEVKWAGTLPADIEPDALPLWPEALGRIGSPNSPTFASDLDQDITRPAITTFYSLRGGVGRSTALGNAAKILAARGRRVVAVDMDLEAPGLAALFGIEESVSDETGVVKILTDLDNSRPDIDISKHLIQVGSEDLFCLPAGRPSANYARMLSLLDPSAWYREEKNPLRQFIELLRSHLPFEPDHILIDSRTGISPISGPLLFDIPDLAVLVFFPHPQAKDGTRVLAEALAAARSSRIIDGLHMTPEPRYLASPVPGGDSFERYSRRAREWVGEWLRPLNTDRKGKPPLLETDLTHIVPYREALASTDQISALKKDWQDYEVVADWIDRLVAQSEISPLVAATVSTQKDIILLQLDFPTGTAESQTDLKETFIETEVIRKALSPDIPLVRGRKGTGKTALFRQLSEDTNNAVVKIVAPQSLQGGLKWAWSADAYRAADEILVKYDLNWQFFWSFFIAARVQFQRVGLINENSPIAEAIPSAPTSEREVVEALERVAQLPRRELLVGEWLGILDKEVLQPTLLLFDGLDTGFGNTVEDRSRRRSASEGLFTFLLDRASQLVSLRLKILIREDIWRQLKFDNKSHLFGRDASLSWGNSEDFYKVVLIHARRSTTFKSLLVQDKLLKVLATSETDSWTQEAVTRAWILLIGERMKGSGTTYTRNWVWNRLADANSDRNPRYLLMLMNLVVRWEIIENRKSRYERSVIRPRALEQQLPEVSSWALSALKEEFEELLPLLERLTNERTPFTADLLGAVSSDIVSLAQEVGLLGVYETRDGSPERYAVPEIYRLALGMKRRGQA